MFVLEAGSRTSMGRSVVGKELKGKKIKNSGCYSRTGDSSGSRHGSLPENCTALSLLRSEAEEGY